MRKGRKLITILLFVMSISLLLSLVACKYDNGDSSSDEPNSSYTSATLPDDSSVDSSVEPEPLDATHLDAIPESLVVTSAVTDQKTAAASWFAAYAENGMEFTAYVLDEVIFAEGENLYSNDGIEIIIAKTQRQKGYTEGVISVSVDALGTVAVKDLFTTEAVEESGVTATTELFTLDDVTVAGYIVKVSVPYAATQITAESKDLSVAFGLTNAIDAMTLNSVYDTAFGVDYQKVHTFAIVAEDGSFAANPYFEYGAVWGNGGSLTASSAWNTDADDDSETAHIYNTESDQDNYVYMHDSDELMFYAEAKISLKQIVNGEMWGKFGLAVTSEDGEKGFFFYVDAAAADGVNANSDAIAVGFNNRATAGNGGWAGNWSNIGSLGGTSAQYTGDNYVTLGIYRQSGVFKLYANGTLVKTVSSGIGYNEKAYVGICCFNMLLDVKEYKLVTDATQLTDYLIQTQSKDYLFLGDSYIDTAFWYSYDSTFGALSAANEGVGGTKTEYWLNMVETMRVMYNPENIIIHIGVNDIDDGNTTGEQTIERLAVLFAAYQAAFPDANIYYVGLVHNMMFKEKWAEYDKVNAYVSKLAETDEKINYIDMASIITADADGSTMKWFNPDGLHYGLDGYAALDKAICSALNIARVDEINGLGSVVADGAPAYSYSSGWKFDEDGVAHNTGSAEAQLYFSNVYAADFYAEAKISIEGLNAADDYAKAGLAIRTEKGMWFWAIDLAKGANANGTYWDNGWSQVFARPEVYGAKDWNWGGCWKDYQWVYNNQYGQSGPSFDYNTDHSFITLAVVKIGQDAYFLSDGKVVNMLKGVFGENEKAAVSVVNFNIGMYVKDAVAYTETTQLKEKLDSLKIYRSTKNVDGDMSDWTAEQLSNPVVIPATDGREVTVYATLAEDGIYLFYDAIHNTFTTTSGNWWENTNIEFRLPDGGQRFASANTSNSRWETAGSRQVNASKFVSVVENGKQHTKAEIFVSYSCIDNYDCTAESIRAGFAWKTGGETGFAWADGDYWYSPEADPGMRNIIVTRKGIKTASLRTIDGDATDWADDTFVASSNGGPATWSGFLGSDGLYVFVKIAAAEIDITRAYTVGDWWMDTNIEFWATDNLGYARILLFNGKLYHSGNITDAAMTYVDGETEDSLYIELFIANEQLSNVTSETQSVKMDFGGQLWSTTGNAWIDYGRGVDIARKA